MLEHEKRQERLKKCALSHLTQYNILPTILPERYQLQDRHTVTYSRRQRVYETLQLFGPAVGEYVPVLKVLHDQKARNVSEPLHGCVWHVRPHAEKLKTSFQ